MYNNLDVDLGLGDDNNNDIRVDIWIQSLDSYFDTATRYFTCAYNANLNLLISNYND